MLFSTVKLCFGVKRKTKKQLDDTLPKLFLLFILIVAVRYGIANCAIHRFGSPEFQFNNYGEFFKVCILYCSNGNFPVGNSGRFPEESQMRKNRDTQHSFGSCFLKLLLICNRGLGRGWMII